MMALCFSCFGAQEVKLRRGRHMADVPCGRCGARDLGPLWRRCPRKYYDDGTHTYYGWGAEAATSGKERYMTYALTDRARDAWYAGYDRAMEWRQQWGKP